MTFKYIAYDNNSNKITGEIQANNIDEAKHHLNHLLIISIKPKSSLNLNLFSSKNKKISKQKLASLFNVLGLYLNSSIPLIKALILTKNQQDDAILLKFIDTVHKYVNEGKSFCSALEIQNIIDISPYIKNIIKIGEETGKLDIVLIEMSKFLKNENKMLNKTTQSLIYPFFIVIVAIFLVSFMLTTIVPKIVNIYQNLDQKLPQSTQIVINIGNFLSNNYILLLSSIFIIIASFSIFYKKNYKFRYFIDSFLLKIPLIKKIIISQELGKFSYLTYILVHSGVNYIQAIDLSVNTIQNENIKAIFLKSVDDVIKGDSFSTALSKEGFSLDRSFLQALTLAEETSCVANILKNTSEIYVEENENRVNIFLSLLEPLLILIVGGVIGFIVTALLLPMLNINILH